MYSSQEWFSNTETGGGGDPGDPIGQSLRFRGSYLERTGSTESNIWSLSFWVKKALVNTAVTLFQASSRGQSLSFNSSNQLSYTQSATNGSTSVVYRDPSAWYHVVYNYTSATDTLNLWVNGEQEDQNLSNGANSWGGTVTIGQNGGSQEYYLSDVHFIDGQALLPTAFGRYNEQDVWVPVKPEGLTFGSNGFHLDFSDPDDLGADRSGNGNDFTPSGFNTDPVGIYSNMMTTDGTTINNPANMWTAGDAVGTDTAPNGSGLTIDFDTPINVQSTVWVHVGSNNIEARLNGGAWNAIASSTPGTPLPFSGELNQIELRIATANKLQVRKIVIDGTQLVNNTGTNYDLMLDSPTQNYSIQNPLGYPGGSSNSTYFTDANLNTNVPVSGTTIFYPSFLEVPETGKYKFETTGTGSIKRLNFANKANIARATAVGGASTGNAFCTQIADGNWYSHGGTLFPTMGNTNLGDDNYVCLIDADNKNVYVGNGTNWLKQIPINSPTGLGTVSNGPFDLATPTFTYSYVADEGLCIMSGVNTSSSPAGTEGLYNYGQIPFKFDNPGFVGLQTQNLPEAPIPNGRDHFRAITTGSGMGKQYRQGQIDITSPFVADPAEEVPWRDSSLIDYVGVVTLDGGQVYDNLTIWSVSGGSGLEIYISEDGTTWTNTGSTTLGTGVQTYSGPARYIRYGNGGGTWQADYFVGVGTLDILGYAQQTFPDGLWWIKDRVNTNEHQLVSSINGTAETLTSPSNAFKANYTAPAGNSVAWCWNCPDTFTPTCSETLVSARRNVAAGFSMVRITGASTSPGAAQNFEHGLNAAPEFVLMQQITGSDPASQTALIRAWSAELTAGNTLYLNSSNQQGSSDNTVPTGTTPTLVNYLGIGNPGSGPNPGDIVFFNFAPIPGYSAFGSYTGNNDNDGPSIYTGFRPAFLLIKCSGYTADWVIWDSTRSTSNPADVTLFPNLTQDEYPNDNEIDFLSNGFKVRNPDLVSNNINTYIWAAFAENPFSLPTTAR